MFHKNKWVCVRREWRIFKSLSILDQVFETKHAPDNCADVAVVANSLHGRTGSRHRIKVHRVRVVPKALFTNSVYR